VSGMQPFESVTHLGGPDAERLGQRGCSGGVLAACQRCVNTMTDHLVEGNQGHGPHDRCRVRRLRLTTRHPKFICLRDDTIHPRQRASRAHQSAGACDGPQVTPGGGGVRRILNIATSGSGTSGGEVRASVGVQASATGSGMSVGEVRVLVQQALDEVATMPAKVARP